MIGYMAAMVLIAVAIVLLMGIAALLTGDDERHVRAERHDSYVPRHAAWLPVPIENQRAPILMGQPILLELVGRAA